ncbi:MAG: Crp/Fnr family transcriptional regulator [Spirochaetales bacterium]|nr:Crp/Fnr family transcriptional regulator [Spirochaetales bacterium]MCF7939351.1 Crp/Fnr family transcriptional regulator [Spirochaetales bacterium]
MSTVHQREMVYQPGDVIFTERDPGEAMYILREGAVELRKKTSGGERVLKIVDQQNDFFGEMALIDGQPRSATAIALQPTRLLAVDQRMFEQLILANGKFALKVIRVLSDRIRNSNLHITELTTKEPKERFIMGMVDYAQMYGEQIYDGGKKIDIPSLKEWINSHLGMSAKEVENHVYRLLKVNEVRYAAAGNDSKNYVVLSAEFLSKHDRRGCVDYRRVSDFQKESE